MPEEISQGPTGQAQQKKRGRKPKGFNGDDQSELYRHLFQILKELEKHPAKPEELDKVQILQIAQDQNIPQSLAEVIIAAIEFHQSFAHQKKTLEAIRERIVCETTML